MRGAPPGRQARLITRETVPSELCLEKGAVVTPLYRRHPKVSQEQNDSPSSLHTDEEAAPRVEQEVRPRGGHCLRGASAQVA